MIRMTLAALAMFAFVPVALADDKPSAEETKKIEAALAEWGCSGGDFEKEDSGIFEIDDSKCKAGQFDFKISKDFKVMVMTAD